MKIELTKTTNNLTDETTYFIWIEDRIVGQSSDLAEAERKYAEIKQKLNGRMAIVREKILSEEI